MQKALSSFVVDDDDDSIVIILQQSGQWERGDSNPGSPHKWEQTVPLSYKTLGGFI